MQGQVLLGWSSSIACFHQCLQDQASLNPSNTTTIQTNQKPTKKKKKGYISIPSHFLHFSEIQCSALTFPPFLFFSRQSWAKIGDWVLVSTAFIALPSGAMFFGGRRGIHQNVLSLWGRLGQKHLLFFLKSCAGHFSESWQIRMHFV